MEKEELKAGEKVFGTLEIDPNDVSDMSWKEFCNYRDKLTLKDCTKFYKI